MFYPLDPDAESIEPLDIAHSLALQNRYNGHTVFGWSVAAHCVQVSRFTCPEHALWGLLHDATEAYLGDVIRPLKQHLPEYRAAEDRLMEVIAERFGLIGQTPDCVHEADSRILLDERAVLLGPAPAPWGYEHLGPLGAAIDELTAAQARDQWLDRFAELQGAGPDTPPGSGAGSA